MLKKKRKKGKKLATSTFNIAFVVPEGTWIGPRVPIEPNSPLT